jgi:predicted HNH restriction endonuclease
MPFITVIWHDEESNGFTDLLPVEWFSSVGVFRDRVHDVRGPKSGQYQAKCNVTVRSTSADLDYEKHAAFNDAHNMFLGVQRIQFANSSRETVTQVLWRYKDEKKLIPFPVTVGWEDDSDTSVFYGPDLVAVEGGKYLASHLARERSPKLVAAKKAAVLKKTGKLACEACGFVFTDKYGALGENFCEVHHRSGVPKKGKQEVRLDDLAVLCSNCHRMIHRSGKPMLSVEAFSKKHLFQLHPRPQQS